MTSPGQTLVFHPDDSEKGRVEKWRFDQLVAADFPPLIAQLLAESDVDLHRAVELAGKCGPTMAAEILR